jgi:NAD(P) transhydrogenase subunit alpha
MTVGVPKEILPGETRVALIPERVAVLTGAGHEVLVQSGAGEGAYFADQAYQQAGARIVPDAETIYREADVVVKVRAPATAAEAGSDELSLLRAGSVLVALLDPLGSPERLGRLAERRVTGLSLDAMPRITRAQNMDVLSSMATIAGYRAAIMGALYLGKFFPLLMTAAGTVTPARVLVLGAGVAGLQAIATAKRLGAVIQAFDTRPVVREQVESLGASFLTLQLKVEQAQDAGGYARALEEETSRAERELLAEPVRQADVIITTAAVPGARAPVLITSEMVASMRPGSVIIDLAASTGGNCVLTEPDRRVVAYGVVIEGPTNLPATMPVHASQLFSRNVATFVTHLLAQGLKQAEQGGELQINLADEIIRATCVTHAGEIVHAGARARWEALQGGAARHEQHVGA